MNTEAAQGAEVVPYTETLASGNGVEVYIYSDEVELSQTEALGLKESAAPEPERIIMAGSTDLDYMDWSEQANTDALAALSQLRAPVVVITRPAKSASASQPLAGREAVTPAAQLELEVQQQ